MSDSVPDLLNQLVATPEMQRLSDIGMHCGCEYANLPLYKRARVHYTRLMHSLSVALIIWDFTDDIEQAVAGLLHDIATPVFAHTIDFMNKDHLKQESTEDKTQTFIENSNEIMTLLRWSGIHAEDVSDYHQYPIADNDTPMLSADRMEYTLGNGYILHHMELSQIQEFYDDLCVAKNERGVLELCFRSIGYAKQFVEISLRNSRCYVSDEDRFLMQYLSDMIRHAIKLGVLSSEDLYTTESKVIGKLNAHDELSEAWDKYTKISKVSVSGEKLNDRYCVNVPAKKRYIDPLVLTDGGAKRISKLDADVNVAIESFLRLDFDKWLSI